MIRHQDKSAARGPSISVLADCRVELIAAGCVDAHAHANEPEALLLGSLLGAYVTSITCGLLLVFLLPGSSTASTTKHTLNPILDITLGVFVLLIVARVERDRDRRPRALARAQT